MKAFIYLDLLIEDGDEIDFDLTDDLDEIDFELEEVREIIIEPEPYEGETEVIPAVTHRTVLETTGKVMRRDVTVLEVQVSVVTNPQGGLTYYID